MRSPNGRWMLDERHLHLLGYVLPALSFILNLVLPWGWVWIGIVVGLPGIWLFAKNIVGDGDRTRKQVVVDMIARVSVVFAMFIAPWVVGDAILRAFGERVHCVVLTSKRVDDGVQDDEPGPNATEYTVGCPDGKVDVQVGDKVGVRAVEPDGTIVMVIDPVGILTPRAEVVLALPSIVLFSLLAVLSTLLLSLRRERVSRPLG